MTGGRGSGGKRPVRPYRVRRAQVKEERPKRVRALARAGEQALAERMGACRPARYSCGSGACPVCHGKLQQHLAAAVWETARRECRPGETVVVLTWVPDDAAVPVGELHTREHMNQMRVWKRRLSGANLRWAVGGVDFSANEERDGSQPATWFPHLYLLGVTRDVEELRAQLAAKTKATPAVPRPVVVKVWDGRPNAALYALKGEFTRRVGYQGERYDKRRNLMAPSRKTSKQKLLAAQKHELWEHLDRIGPTSRIFALRVQLYTRRHYVKIRLLGW